MKAILVVGLAVLAGCASGGGGAKVAGKATTAQEAVLLDRVKSLQGTWVMKDEQGKEHTACVFAVCSGGSAVREIMFPGSDEEMTNMYHMDGATLVMTHYCAMGNQPRMRATPGDRNVIDLRFDSVTNLASADQGYMGQMKLTIKDADHIVEDWGSLQNGKPQPHATFALARKK